MFWKFLKYIFKEHKLALITALSVPLIVIYIVTNFNTNGSNFRFHGNEEADINNAVVVVAIIFLILVLLGRFINKLK